MDGDACPPNPVFLELGWIRTLDQRHNNAALLYDVVRTGEGLFAYRIEHGVHILRDIFKFRLCIIHRHVCAELLEEGLICRRSSCNDAGSARFRYLDREATNTA